MNYYNFSVSKQKGFYLKSKTAIEGYEKVTYGTSGEKTTYHQYHKKIQGIPSKVEVKSFEFEGKNLKFLEFSLLENANVVNKISVPLKTKHGYTDEAKALISALRALEPNEPVSVSTSFKQTKGANEKMYDNFNIYINYDNKKNDAGKSISTGFIPYSELPAPTSKDVAGEKAWDFSAQTEFYYQILVELTERFKGTDSAPQASSTPQPEGTAVDATASEALPADDLPF